MRFLLACILALNFAFAFVLDEGKILNQAVSLKIEEMSAELMQKSGVFSGVALYQNLGQKSLEQSVKELNLKPPYAVILLAIDKKRVEIFADEASLKLFDKEQILSPYPERGSILPILASKKGDIYNAAILNGYADLAEQIAASKGVKLQSAIGSANKNTLNLFRFIVYGLIAVLILTILFRKFRGKNG